MIYALLSFTSIVILGETKVYSVSLLNENYEMVFEPTYIDLE